MDCDQKIMVQNVAYDKRAKDDSVWVLSHGSDGSNDPRYLYSRKNLENWCSLVQEHTLEDWLVLHTGCLQLWPTSQAQLLIQGGKPDTTATTTEPAALPQQCTHLIRGSTRWPFILKTDRSIGKHLYLTRLLRNLVPVSMW